MNGISGIIPLKKIAHLEERIHKKMLKGGRTLQLSQKLKKIKNQAKQACGFSEDALTVYTEFYKSSLAYFTARGEKL
jgi:hypothetical protein